MVFLKRVLFSSSIRTFRPTKRMYSSGQTEPEEESDDVLFETIKKKGVITLNKPKALNAINTTMVCKIHEKLQEWENCLDLVVIRGGDKAFCAGGDIVSITKEGPKGAHLGKTFFRTEYLMNNMIGTYKIPYIALIHGITMGGGVGLSVHGQYRVATENTLFAMPETAIGLFPDVGGTYVLPRLGGKLGLFLALTGHRLKGADVVKAGIATHYCQSKDLSKLYDAIMNMKGPCAATQLKEEIFPKYTEDVQCHPFSLATKMDKINKIFSAPTVEDMMCTLKEDGSEWCHSIYKTLQKMSPLSLKLTKKALEFGPLMTLQECLQMENRMGAAVMEGKQSLDFYEGVRALLVDKDKKPKWSPSKLEDVTEEMLEAYFKKLPSGEELVI